METFTSLTDVYAVVDAPDFLPEHMMTPAQWFQKVRDHAHATGDLATVNKAQIEMDVCNLMLKDGMLLPLAELTTEDGRTVFVPNIGEIGEETLDYIVFRCEHTHSPVLKSRYAHVLWSSTRKHRKFADNATEEYLNVSRMREKEDLAFPKDHHGLEVVYSIKAAFMIAVESRSGLLANVVAEIDRVILNFNEDSSSSFALRLNLVELALKNAKLFRDRFPDYLKYLRRFATTHVDDGHRAIETLRVCEKLGSFLGMPVNDILEEQAAAWEMLSDQRQAGDMAKEYFGMRSLALYKRTGKQEKVDELNHVLVKYRTETKLSKVETTIDMRDAVKEYTRMADDIFTWDSENILEWLVVSPDLLPDPMDVQSSAEKLSKGAIHMLFPAAPINKWGHTFAHYDSPEEKERYQFLDYYSKLMDPFYAAMHQIVLRRILTPEKINSEALLDFMRRRIWFCGDLERKFHGARSYGYTWLDQLRPGLKHYLEALVTISEEGDGTEAFVLFIDSVTAKIEGIVRDLADSGGVVISVNEADRLGRGTTRLRYIHDLLRDDKVAELLPEETLEFLKWLLIEQGGINLRHSVAHSDMEVEQYNEIIAHWLFLALMRLARVELPPPGGEHH